MILPRFFGIIRPNNGNNPLEPSRQRPFIIIRRSFDRFNDNEHDNNDNNSNHSNNSNSNSSNISVNGDNNNESNNNINTIGSRSSINNNNINSEDRNISRPSNNEADEVPRPRIIFRPRLNQLERMSPLSLSRIGESFPQRRTFMFNEPLDPIGSNTFYNRMEHFHRLEQPRRRNAIFLGYQSELFFLSSRLEFAVPIEEPMVLEESLKTAMIFKCPICFCVVQRAKECRFCNQVFCGNCIAMYARSGKDECPKCRKTRFIQEMNRNLKEVLNGVKLMCPNGCKKEITYKDLETHYTECKNDFKCEECKMYGKYEDVKKHMKLHNENFREQI